MSWEPDYASSGELRSWLQIGDNDDDTELALAVTSASRAIDEATSRQFGATDATEERTFTLDWDRDTGLWVASIDDLMTTTGLVVTVDGSAVASGDYALRGVSMEDRNAAQRGRPWELLGVRSGTSASLGTGPLTVLVEATWGWSAVPDTIKTATLIQSARFFKRRVAEFGVAGSPEMGSETRLLAKVDPDVAVMVSGYNRNRGFA